MSHRSGSCRKLHFHEAKRKGKHKCWDKTALLSLKERCTSLGTNVGFVFKMYNLLLCFTFVNSDSKVQQGITKNGYFLESKNLLRLQRAHMN